jgi:hypothetical protein
VLDDIGDLLRRYFKLDEDFYEIKRALVDDILDEDERLDALGQFLHLSNYSDNFACDLVGVLPGENGDLRPLLFEVKSTGRGSVLISAAEWRQAKTSANDYALLVVHRPTARGQPHRLDLLIDPYGQFPPGSRHLATDTWHLTIPPSGDPPAPRRHHRSRRPKAILLAPTPAWEGEAGRPSLRRFGVRPG